MELGQNKIKQLRRALNRNPNDLSANIGMGMYYIHKEDIPSALPYLERAHESNPENAELCFIIANACRGIGNHDKSEFYFVKALEKSPDNYEYMIAFGQLLQLMNKSEMAVMILEKAASLRPVNYELLNDIGVLYYQQHNRDKASHYLQKALEINPQYHLAMINLCYVLLASNELEQALRLIDRMENLIPFDPEFAELKAICIQKSQEMPGGKTQIITDLTFSEQLFEITPLSIIKNFGEKRIVDDIGLSVVIPIHNEIGNLPILYKELTDVLANLKEPYEIILVNDGSTDGSRDAMDEIAAQDRSVKVIHFRRNYGQTAAMNAGFKYAEGSVIITMDGDLQNDPADIPRLLEKMAQGYDLVSGWRRDRKDTLITRKIPSMAANRIINKLIEGTQVQLHDFGCTLKAYKKGIVKNIDLYGEMHRFIPVFAAWLGVKVTEIPVNHRPRVHGYAKYNLSRVSRVIFDLVVVRFFSDYMTRPIQFFGKIAKKLLSAGIIILILLGLLAAFTPFSLTPSTFIILGALLMFACLQFVSIGLLGELMMRSYFEIQKKDSFVVEKITNERPL